MAKCSCQDRYPGSNCSSKNLIALASGTTGATGAAGAAGADGVGILYNSISVPVQSAAAIGLQTLLSWTLDNTPTPKLSSAGDILYIEAYLSMVASINIRILYLLFGATTVNGWTYVPPNNTEFLLKTYIHRVNATSQRAVSFAEYFGLGPPVPVVKYGNPTGIITLTENLAADIIIYVKCDCQGAAALGDVTLKYLLVEKHKI